MMVSHTPPPSFSQSPSTRHPAQGWRDRDRDVWLGGACLYFLFSHWLLEHTWGVSVCGAVKNTGTVVPLPPHHGSRLQGWRWRGVFSRATFLIEH